MTRQEIETRQNLMFMNVKLNPKVEEVLESHEVFDLESIIPELYPYGIFTPEQLEIYLTDYHTHKVELLDGATTTIYAKEEDVEYFPTYAEMLREKLINPDRHVRFCKTLSNGHEEVISLLTFYPMTLSEIQYELRNMQSKDGIRGRVSELVDKGIVKRYYFSLQSKKSGEIRSYTYHYLAGFEQKSLAFLEDKIVKAETLNRVYLGEEFRERILKAIAQRPVFVIELAEIFDIPETKLLLMLRELESVNEVSLFYQSILKDGKNGKFIVYLPDNEEQLRDLYKEIRHFFLETTKHRDFVELYKDQILDYDTIADALGISDSLCIAFLTNLRKREIIEQHGEEVVFSAFHIAPQKE